MNSREQKSTFKIFIVIVMILETIALSGIIIYLVSGASPQADGDALSYENSPDGKYVLYIGLNDKDTYTQLISTDKAKKLVNDICTRYVDGYTVTVADGGWVDETGTLTEEASLIYTISNARESDIVAIMDEVLAALNQNSILVEKQEQSYTYYSGNE